MNPQEHQNILESVKSFYNSIDMIPNQVGMKCTDMPAYYYKNMLEDLSKKIHSFNLSLIQQNKLIETIKDESIFAKRLVMSDQDIGEKTDYGYWEFLVRLGYLSRTEFNKIRKRHREKWRDEINIARELDYIPRKRVKNTENLNK